MLSSEMVVVERRPLPTGRDRQSRGSLTVKNTELSISTRGGGSFDAAEAASSFQNETDFPKKVGVDMKHIAVIDIKRSEYDRVNRLLAIQSLSAMSDTQLLQAGANTDQCEGILYVKFDDGSCLNFDLCSGQENYFDDVVWTSPDGRHDVILECTFELDDIEFEAMGEEYEVKLNIQQD